jgi:hypothetical protein
MPNVGELIAEIVRGVGEVLSASSLRLGAGPTLAVLGVLLVLLQLVTRPTTRWTSRDPGGLAAIGRAMALAAEAGASAVVNLGTAGIARATSATARLQTLAALPILGHVARAAARAGVPLHVTTNDPLAAVAAAASLESAHLRTATTERVGRSRVRFDGEGRVVSAGVALADPARPAAAFADGSIGEEGMLLLGGLAAGSGSTSFGTAEGGQASTVLLTGEGALIGPQLLAAPAELRAVGAERTGVVATDRLVAIAIGVILIATALALSGIVDLRPFLIGAE